MIKVRSKNHDNVEVLLNENNILYVVPAMQDGSIVYFTGGGYLTLSDTIASVDKQIKSLIEVPKLEQPKSIAPLSTIQTFTNGVGIKNPTPNLDGFPEHLKRMSNGKVDPRTKEYKEYIASTGV